jgi:FADH2 O2-dependent halogenase
LDWFEQPPFPVDDAAVHHVFDGGWIWVLRFNNGITSAGAAVTAPLADDLRLQEGAAGWQRLLEMLPSVQEQFTESVAERPFTFWPKLAFRSRVAAGPNWAMLPSAAGIVDPLLSTGFPLNLLGIERLARMLKTKVTLERLQSYEQQTLADLDAAGELVAALYANMGRFARFKKLSLLYFTAAIYTETMRRLRRTTASGFLLREDERFARPFRRACELATNGSEEALFSAVDEALQLFDLGGLADQARNGWYPCLLQDLLASASKIGASEEQLRAIFPRKTGENCCQTAAP